MRIACLQFSPHLGDVDNNMSRADLVLNNANPEDLDLLVLPEMAFSGYNFESMNQIFPFLEPTSSALSSLWARTKALRFDCHVVVGYPEKADPKATWPTNLVEYYNSAVMVGPDGENVAHYRKTFLYYTDRTWALEGDGFYEGHIKGLGQTAMGICMDINPKNFEAPWEKYEFANHILQCHANLVIFSMAWVTLDPPDAFTSAPNKPDLATLAHWALRLEPLVRAESSDEIIIVFANRAGSEGDAVYAGTSAVLGICDGVINVYGVLGRWENRLLVVDTSKPPKQRLVRVGNEYRLVRLGTGSGGSQSQTAVTCSSAKADEGEKREREKTRTRSREQSSTPSRWKEAVSTPVLYDPSRQPPLAPTPSTQRGSSSLTPSLTPGISKKGKNQPHKLTIPDTSSHLWRKSNETMTGSPAGTGGTPIRKKLKDIWEPQVTRPAPTAPDSAVVLSAVERPRGTMFSPTDSAIGRATPDMRAAKSCRRSGEHRSSNIKEVPKLDTILAEEIATEEEAALRAQTLKDSPVARRPDSSVFTNWLETLPPVKDLESASNTPPLKFSDAVSDTPPVRTFETVSNTPPVRTSKAVSHTLPVETFEVISNTPPTDPEVRPVRGETPSRGCAVCHACGQEILKDEKNAAKRKSEKKPPSKAVAKEQGPKGERAERERKDNSVSQRPETLLNGYADSGGQRLDGEEHGETQGGALLQVEKKDDGVLQLQVFDAEDPTRRPTREPEADVAPTSKARDGVMRVGEEKKDSHPTADKAVRTNRAPRVGVELRDSTQVEKSKPHVNGIGGASNGMEKTETRRLVPPPIKGMEKVVTVGIRPSSVAW